MKKENYCFDGEHWCGAYPILANPERNMCLLGYKMCKKKVYTTYKRETFMRECFTPKEECFGPMTKEEYDNIKKLGERVK